MSHFGHNQAKTPEFNQELYISEAISTRLPPLESEDEYKETTTPKTAASNQSRNSGKTVILKDSPAYKILKGTRCSNIRKYRFKISDKVSYID